MELLQYKMWKNFEKSYHAKYKKNSQKSQKQNDSQRKSCIQASFQTSFRSIFFYILLMMMLPLCSTQDFTNNLIINGNFSEPKLSWYGFFPLSVKGWSCSQICELKNCDRERTLWLTRNLFDSDCTGQVLDLNSNFNNEVVTQKVELTAGKYLLHFNYYYPAQASKKKKMKVMLNDQILLYVWPQVNYSFDVFHYQQVVQAIQGQNVISFANQGLNDGIGFKINNVSLFRIVDTNLMDWLEILSEKVSNLNSCPGFRVVFRNLLSFMINFDRLELYIYHKRRYSYNMQQLLAAINNFLDFKSNAATGILGLLNKKVVEQVEILKNEVQFKDFYHSYPSFSKDYAEVSYLDNLNESFVYFFPFVILLVIVLNILFSLSFRSPISVAFRKFSLWVITLVMIFDGNIENLTFFTLTEFKTYFSASITHKVLNIFVLFLFFLLLFIAFGLLHWAKYHYKKKVKFLLDEQDSKMATLWGIIIDRGIICFLFGVVHCTLLELPFAQLVFLIVLEVSWMGKKLYFIRKGLYDQNYLVLASVLNGCGRVFFQISCLIYESRSESRIHINEVLHTDLIYIIIGLSFLQFLIGFLYTLRSLWKVFVKTSQRIFDDLNHQQRLMQNPIKEKGQKKCLCYQQTRPQEKKIYHEQSRDQRLNQKTLPKGVFQRANRNIKDVNSYLRSRKDNLTVINATFQASGILKTRRTRIRKYDQ